MNQGGKKGFNKRGQVTIFIIIAIVVIGLAVVLYNVIPGVKTGSETSVQTPNSFIQQCLESDIESLVNTISIQGGNFEPESYVLYQDTKVSYLCYSEDSLTCSIQQPLLKQHIESELQEKIQPLAQSCFQALKESYESQGYDVQLQPGNTLVELLPGKVSTTMDYIVTLTKSDTQRYDLFSVVLNNNLYELTGIANSIISWESLYGDAETTVYMSYYRDLKVEKKKPESGTTIYILTNRDKGNKFQFAIKNIELKQG